MDKSHLWNKSIENGIWCAIRSQSLFEMLDQTMSIRRFSIMIKVTPLMTDLSERSMLGAKQAEKTQNDPRGSFIVDHFRFVYEENRRIKVWEKQTCRSVLCLFSLSQPSTTIEERSRMRCAVHNRPCLSLAFLFSPNALKYFSSFYRGWSVINRDEARISLFFLDFSETSRCSLFLDRKIFVLRKQKAR